MGKNVYNSFLITWIFVKLDQSWSQLTPLDFTLWFIRICTPMKPKPDYLKVKTSKCKVTFAVTNKIRRYFSLTLWQDCCLHVRAASYLWHPRLEASPSSVYHQTVGSRSRADKPFSWPLDHQLLSHSSRYILLTTGQSITLIGFLASKSW